MYNLSKSCISKYTNMCMIYIHVAYIGYFLKIIYTCSFTFTDFSLKKAIRDVELALKLKQGHMCSLILRSALTKPLVR